MQKWNTIILNHAKNGQGKQALHFYHEMLHNGFMPDKGTYLSALKACSSIKNLTHGKMIHEHISKRKFDHDVVIGSSLVDMYVKCGRIDIAHSVFDKLEHRNVVSWSAMILGYVNCGQGLVALTLFEKMKEEGIRPDRVVYLCILKACCGLNVARYGRLIHNQIMMNSFESDVALGSSLVDFYAKCRSLEEAHNVFENLQARNVVTWSSLIMGYTNHENDMMAFELFEKMQMHGITPGRVAFLSILKVCGNMNAIRRGRLVHDHVVKGSLETDLSLGSTLIDMYGKCGSIEGACSVFHYMHDHNTLSWNALLIACAQCGQGVTALNIFQSVHREMALPDNATFIGLLSACSHSGLVNEGEAYFESMREGYGFTPQIQHYTCMVDLFSQTGRFDKAMEVLNGMPPYYPLYNITLCMQKPICYEERWTCCCTRMGT